ncbi:hypothetical protein C1I98_30900 [Spongiactinospora gelatinilytica]|uniref:Peptidase inhibitor family I36 n=1 Tax=Spongiactinospora gelatinilytica TaxID=2666298 RepID=A0A2W2G0A3_9ACTN|nr:hypothetical protein C1I98_30900 [Spongiactinospora gelatinilytica]
MGAFRKATALTAAAAWTAGILSSTPAQAAPVEAPASTAGAQSAIGAANLSATAPSRAVAWDDATGVPLAAYECNARSVCFWTGRDGKGSRCMWPVDDPNWSTGDYKCSWAGTEPKSIRNTDTASRYNGVAYYRDTGWNTRVGCTRQGGRGNLYSGIHVLSHQWVTGRCG